MPHVALVPFTGLRIRERQLLELGMSLPGLRRRSAAIAELPALGLLTLAGLTPQSWTQSYHESELKGSDAGGTADELVEQVVAQQPTLAAVSALTASVREAYQFSQKLRKRGIPVVIGGLHATVLPDEALTHCDSVVIGEGEPVWRQVLGDAAAGRLQRQYRSAAPFDLAHAPLPRFDLLGDRQRPRMTLQTERGCPFACDFCGASRLLGPFREKPVNRVAAELAALHRLDPGPWLELADDNTFAGQRDPLPLLEALRQSGARFFTEADWRIGERPELLRELALSGCVQVLVGIESLVFRYPGMGEKRAELSRIMNAVDAIQQSGVVVNGCFIIGAEGETEASLDRLTQFVLGSPLAEVQLTLQTPFPGTSLYRRLLRQGRLLEDRGWPHYTLFDVVYRPDRMTVVELEAGFRRVISAVFSPAASARREQIRRAVWKRRSAARVRQNP